MAEWCTIESDPGVFTELISNIGVKGVQVEEILDFDMIQANEPTYGLIFLFKYIPNSGYNPNVLTSYDEDLYFPQQVIVNACATQAILSILMNNEDKVELGPDLLELKSFTKLMDPYMKGLSISNSDKIRNEHNKFARPEPFVFTEKKKATEEDDVFHFVAYIHFKDNIYEIDGLREGPILIAENAANNEWIEKVKPAIINRINLYASNEIKFNLMAVVPDKRLKAKEMERELSFRKNYISKLLTGQSLIEEDYKFSEYDSYSKEDLERILNDLDFEMENVRALIDYESNKFDKYKLENERRQHNYIPFIFEVLKIMSEKSALEDIYNEALKKEEENKK